jgi:hypothetical protein
MNGDSRSTNEKKGVLPWLVLFGLVVPVQDIFVLPWWLSSGPVQKKFLLTVHYFNAFVPIAQQAGHAVVLGQPVS